MWFGFNSRLLGELREQWPTLGQQSPTLSGMNFGVRVACSPGLYLVAKFGSSLPLRHLQPIFSTQKVFYDGQRLWFCQFHAWDFRAFLPFLLPSFLLLFTFGVFSTTAK